MRGAGSVKSLTWGSVRSVICPPSILHHHPDAGRFFLRRCSPGDTLTQKRRSGRRESGVHREGLSWSGLTSFCLLGDGNCRRRAPSR